MKIATLCDLDRVPIPLVYPQLVFLSVNIYFLVSLVSRQYLLTLGGDDKSEVYSEYFLLKIQNYRGILWFLGWLSSNLLSIMHGWMWRWLY